MENINIQTQNKIENYQPTPNLFYDIEGKVVHSDGKKLTLEKEVGFEVMEYTLDLKEEQDLEVGDQVKIDKEDIRNVRLEKKEKILPEDIENIGEILRALGLDNTNANIVMVNKLIKQGIKPTKINVSNYMRSLDNLDQLEASLSVEKLVKILDKSVDIESLRLDEVLDQLGQVQEEPKGILDFFTRKKDLDYKDAENIAKEVFGQKMGKDIYDIIIALDRQDIEINQPNIERVMELLTKLDQLKDVKDIDLVDLLKQDLDFTINNLYRLKNKYSLGSLDENKFAAKMEKLTINKEVDYQALVEVLSREEVEASDENISLAREFVLMDMDIDSSKMDQLRSMKKSLDFVRENLDEGQIASLLESGLDLENQAIEDLEQLILKADQGKAPEFIDLSFLDQVEDQHLLKILKAGGDFRLEDLKNIVETQLPRENTLEFKVLDRTLRLNTILNYLGETPDLKDLEYGPDLSLGKIYEELVNQETAREQNLGSNPEKEFLLVEYQRFRDNITTKLIRKSLNENVDLEKLPLDEANNYMENKINKYKKASSLMEEFNTIYKNKEVILPTIINNQLNMDYGSMQELASYLSGGSGLTKLIGSLGQEDKGSFKQDTARKKQEISNKLKDRQDIRQEYFELMELLSNFNSGTGDQAQEKRDQYFSTRNKASKQDLVLQVPVDLDGFKDLNIIIPDLNKGIDKHMMNFRLGLETEKLGRIDMNLEVVGKNIYLDMDSKLMDKYGDLLRARLEDSGYNLV